MLNNTQKSNRWGSQQKFGAVLPARALAKATGGYTVELEGPVRTKGLLQTHEFVKLGANVLVKLIGYSNGLPILTPIWAAQC